MIKKTVTEKFDEQGRMVERITVTEEQMSYVYTYPSVATTPYTQPYPITYTTSNNVS